MLHLSQGSYLLPYCTSYGSLMVDITLLKKFYMTEVYGLFFKILQMAFLKYLLIYSE